MTTETVSLPARIGRHLWKEFLIVLPPTIYFFCAFNVIVLTSNLVTHRYWFALTNFMFATVLALIVGKVILVSDKFSFLERYRGRPLWRPILFKSVFYTVIVLLVRYAEHQSHFLRDERGYATARQAALDAFTWERFAAIQIWLFVCFLIYVTVVELSKLSGQRFVTLFFRRGP